MIFVELFKTLVFVSVLVFIKAFQFLRVMFYVWAFLAMPFDIRLPEAKPMFPRCPLRAFYS